MPETLWIGGWASDLSAWSEAIAARYPDRGHRFLDAHALIDGQADLRAEAARLGPDDGLAAWSLGSLLLHRELAQGWRPACATLSLCPIFDFCREGGPWPRSVVLRMARRLGRERQSVLEEFRAAAWGRSHVASGLSEAWTCRAAAYPADSLARGLAVLAETQVDPAAAGLEACLFLASEADPLAPVPSGLEGDLRLRTYPAGHLPFLDYPETVGPLLRAGGGPS
jgi:hypothetical protein